MMPAEKCIHMLYENRKHYWLLYITLLDALATGLHESGLGLHLDCIRYLIYGELMLHSVLINLKDYLLKHLKPEC